MAPSRPFFDLIEVVRTTADGVWRWDSSRVLIAIERDGALFAAAIYIWGVSREVGRWEYEEGKNRVGGEGGAGT